MNSEVKQRTGSLAITGKRTALVVIDLQNRTAAMDVFPRPAAEVIRNAGMLADSCRKRGILVVLVRGVPVPPVGLRPDGDIGQEPFGDRPPDWAALVKELRQKEGDVVVTKRQWGAFYGTDLELQLRRRGIDTIVLCGISTNRGVESTARFAYELGFKQIFAEDAMAARSEEEHKFTIRHTFRAIGKVRSTDVIIAAIQTCT